MQRVKQHAVCFRNCSPGSVGKTQVSKYRPFTKYGVLSEIA
jgi:hypothetical protein